MMNNGLLLSIKKHTDTLIEETMTKPEKTQELKLNKQMENASFNSPINFSEKGKWLLAVTSFEATTSVFDITVENNSFSLSIPGHWNSNSAEKIIDKLNNLLELRSQNDIELHVEQVEKKDICNKRLLFIQS